MKKKFLKSACSITLALALAATGTGFGYSSNSISPLHAATAQMQAFSLQDITMTDSYCTNAFSKEVSYLLSFDTNRLLAGFRENAGLSMNNAKRYDGWEGCLIGGHTLGHYLTAIAQAYNNPNLTASEKQQFYNKIKALIDGLLTCQQNSKGKPGFIWGAVKVGNNVESQFDNVENGKTNIITESWVPWYTLHKIIAGLNDVYNLTGYQNAKTVSSNLGDWVYNRCSRWSSQTHSRVLSIEYGGMNDCLYELYHITGKENHAIAAHYFDDTSLFSRIAGGSKNSLNNLHANTTIPKFIGALKRYTILNGKKISGTTVNSSEYLAYAQAFWDTVVNRHTYVTGGNSEWEHFGEDYKLDGERTNCNCETCNVYNMLKLTRELFMLTGDSKYMNYYETTYYNSILSSQNPETGMTTYFQPMAAGYFKVYSSRFNSFWCCTGSGIENFTKLGDTIYMHNGNTLYVNLYQSSDVNWKEQNVVISQKSMIPDGDTSTFTIHSNGSKALDLRFRIPDWCTGTMTIQKNGTACSYTKMNGYAQVLDTFQNGDIVTVKIPESVVAYSLPDNNSSYAFKYGPVVLSAELGTSDLSQTTTGMSVSIPAKKIIGSETVNINAANGSVASFMKNINKFLVKDSNALKFTLTGTDQKLIFTPHYQQYKQRYAIYLYYKSNGTGSYEPVEQAATETTDTVQPGYGQYESDALHAMVDNNSVGVTSDGTYRYAKAGGSFSYRMSIDENAAYRILVVTFRKADNGKSIQIAAGKSVIYAKTLNYQGSTDSYKVKIMIPDSALTGFVQSVTSDGIRYRTVPITFSSNDSKDSARICDFVYMTAVKPNYSIDSSLAYYVNCGDHNTATASNTDKFGMFNSVTEQLYKEDAVTGYTWGLIDDATDKYNGSSKSNGIYTANTWPDEYNTGDDNNKASSFRYTKNQYENNIARHLDYGFQLPNGTYTVEIGLCNPWNCSNTPTIYANYGTAAQTTIASNVSVNGSAVVKGSVTVTDGTLTINARTGDKAINFTYILIKCQSFDALPVMENIPAASQTPSTQPSVIPSPVESTKPAVSLKDGWYYIKSVSAQKYLQVTDNEGTAAKNVEIGTGSGVDGQKWYVTNQDDGSITLRSALGEFNLDIANGSDSDGANIQIYNAYNGTAQKFFAEQTNTENVYVLKTAASTGTKALDVYDFGTADGTNVCQWSLTGNNNQEWVLEPVIVTEPIETSTPVPSQETSKEPAQPSSTPAVSGIDYEYQVVSDWGNGWQGQITITNHSDTTLNDWTLHFNYNASISNLWGAELKEQTGTDVTVICPSWDRQLAPGSEITINFIASGSDKSAPVQYSIS